MSTPHAFAARPAPAWFGQRRYGLFVHMAIATVPGFAPVHEYAEWYWSHISEDRLDDVVLHPAPMPEVQAWHREHHGERTYDDFVHDLTLSRWDADEIAELAVAAGMGYVIHTSKHHDGYCFFDSALTDRTTARSGPRRDPVGELAVASRAAGLVHGLYYSLLDWSHPAYGDPAYVSDYLHPQVMELVERYGPSVLWGDGHWGRPASYWRTDSLLAAYYAAMGDEAAVNDRWGNDHADFVTFEYDTPAAVPARPFEVCRGVAYSFGYNRAEVAGDHLGASELVALLTETVAKGGNLLVDIGPRADGSVPSEQADVLREAGRWIRAHAGAIDGTVPFEVWGDATTRYTVTPRAATSDDGLVHLHAIDLTGARRARFAALVPARFELVDGPPGVTQDHRGVLVDRGRDGATELASVHELVVRPVRSDHIDVRPVRGAAARIGGREFGSIGAALAAAVPGDVVEVADGHHGAPQETFPLHVPAGVTLRGHGATLVAAGSGGTAVVELAGDAASLAGLSISAASVPGFALAAAAVRARDVRGASIHGCTLIESSILVDRCDAPAITGNTLHGGSIVVRDSADADVRANSQSGQRWGTGITIERGTGSRVVGNRVADDLTGIAVRASADALVAANEVRTRWWGVHVDAAEGTTVAGNTVERTMRAICVSGGTGTRVVANRLSRCDSGVMVERGGDDVELLDNTVDDCRLGIFVWESPPPVAVANRVLRPREVAP